MKPSKQLLIAITGFGLILLGASMASMTSAMIVGAVITGAGLLVLLFSAAI